MASDSQSAKSYKKGSSQNPDSDKSRLPFEPTQNRKKTTKKSSSPSVTQSPKSTSGKTGKSAFNKVDQAKSRAFSGVPEVVSKRMARRMAFFCGVPTSLGMLTFIISYLVVSQHLLNLPTIAVLLVSLGFFGLGVVGLSYGALSASWDEDRVGDWLGISEFRTNFGRTVQSWKSAKEEAQ